MNKEEQLNIDSDLAAEIQAFAVDYDDFYDHFDPYGLDRLQDDEREKGEDDITMLIREIHEGYTLYIREFLYEIKTDPNMDELRKDAGKLLNRLKEIERKILEQNPTFEPKNYY